MNANAAYDMLIASGVWQYDSKIVTKNCSKCYSRRYINFNTSTREFTPCTCVKNKMKKLLEHEKKTSIKVINSNSLKEIENIND